MYRIVLTSRYLMSRWLTLLAVVGVFLGVGTLVVVLAVMGGFVKEVRQAVRGGLSDVIIDSDITGFPHYDEFVAMIKGHPNVAEATPVVQLYGLVQIVAEGEQARAGGVQGAELTKTCIIYGVRPAEAATVNKFADYLERQKNYARPSFEVPQAIADQLQKQGRAVRAGIIPGRELVTWSDPRATGKPVGSQDDSVLLSGPGAKLVLSTFPLTPRGSFESVLGTPKVNMRAFTVVDYYESRLYEFDSKYVFIPFEEAQRLGGLGDPESPDAGDPLRAHQVLVRLRDYGGAQQTIADIARMWDELRGRHFELNLSAMSFLTWEERQRTILGVVDMERTLMIILLGLIILVAGFLIGAVLSMIVKEKTRDIGILKSLGASDFGVAQIFLMYAAVVSGVGSLLGLGAGLLFVHYIDPIEAWASKALGITVFPREAYYFDRIPRDVNPVHTALVVVSAIVLAVLCSAVAAWRAARLPPVEALRYE